MKIMSIEKVREHLKKYDLAERIMEFDISSATVAEAAVALGCAEAEIAKTMSFKIDDGAVIIVTAGDTKIDNHKFKEFFGKKAVMLKFEEVEELLGYPVGGVCPFDLPCDIPVYLDNSLLRFEVVYPAAGSRNSAVKLSLKELETTSGAKEWIDVCSIK